MQLFRNLFSEVMYGNVKLHFLSNTQNACMCLFTNISKNGYVFTGMEATSRTKCVSVKILYTLMCALPWGSHTSEIIVEVRREHRSIAATSVTCQHYCCQHTHIEPEPYLVRRHWPWSVHTRIRRRCLNPNLGIYQPHYIVLLWSIHSHSFSPLYGLIVILCAVISCGENLMYQTRNETTQKRRRALLLHLHVDLLH